MFSFLTRRKTSRDKADLKVQMERFAQAPDASSACSIGRRLLAAGRVNEAFRWIRRARVSFPSARAIERLYRQVRSHKARVALRQAQHAAHATPSAENLVEVCDLLRICGKRRRAFRLAKKGDRLYPDNWKIKLALGKLYFHRFGETRARRHGLRAVEYLEQSCALNGTNYTALLLYAICLSRLENYRDSLDVIAEILELWPEDARALSLRSYVGKAYQTQLAASEGKEGDGAEVSRATSEADASLLGKIMAIPGAVAAFLFDTNGEVTDSLVRESDTFEFSAPVEVLESMASACQLDTHRIGLGDLVSCSAAGEHWRFTYRLSAAGTVMAFFEGEGTGETTESELQAVLGEQGEPEVVEAVNSSDGNSP